MGAIGLGFCGGTGGYALIAPVLPNINDDIVSSVSSVRPIRNTDN